MAPHPPLQFPVLLLATPVQVDTTSAVPTTPQPSILPDLQQRLPTEIITNIATILHREGSLGSLSALQRTSRAWYSTLTPLLYSVVGDTTEDIISFFSLFQVLLTSRPGRTVRKDDTQHPITWCRSARMIWSLSQVHHIVFRPITPFDRIAFVQAMRPYRDLRQLIDLSCHRLTLFPKIQSIVVDYSRYPKGPMSDVEQTLCQASIFASQFHFGRSDTLDREISISAIFFDSLGNLDIHHLCLVPGEVHFRDPYPRIPGPVTPKEVTLHRFGSSFSRIPMIKNVTLDFKPQKVTDYVIAGEMGDKLLSHVKRGLRHQPCVVIERIYIVEPNFDQFWALDRQRFEKGMDTLFPNKGNEPKLSLIDRLNQNGEQKDNEKVGNKWTFWSYLKEDYKGKKPHCKHCGRRFH